MARITLEEKYDMLVELGVVTQSELSLVCAILGYNESMINKIIFVCTGYQTYEDWWAEEIEEEES